MAAPVPAPACTLTSADRDRALRVPSLVVAVTAPGQPAVERPLALAPVTVGTGADCEVVVVDPRVSRRHCEVRLTTEGVVLRDLGSKNGTFVGRLAVREAIVPPGEAVRLGDTVVVVRATGAPTTVPLSAEGRFGDAIGASYPMRALFARLERAAATEQTVLLLGESGTGKEVLARAVHAHSPRRDRPLIVLDCAAVSASLLEAELFGYARGAFTGAIGARAGLLEQAHGGTLFIDEIGELPLDLQPKLLRALETRQVRRLGEHDWRPCDARVIAATHRDLRGAARRGEFREDLYYRLAVLEARVPALRERPEDLPALVARFLASYDPPRALADLPANALALLAAHAFPGNVRELRNLVARLVVFAELPIELAAAPVAGAAVATTAVASVVAGAVSGAAVAVSGAASGAPVAGASSAVASSSPSSSPSASASPAGGASAHDRLSPFLQLPLPAARELVMEQFERGYVTAKLAEHGGNISRAAEAMGVSRQLVHRLLDRYGMKARG